MMVQATLNTEILQPSLFSTILKLTREYSNIALQEWKYSAHCVVSLLLSRRSLLATGSDEL